MIRLSGLNLDEINEVAQRWVLPGIVEQFQREDALLQYLKAKS
jgi:hypothetical protein